MTENILEVTDLCVEFETFGGTVQAVRGVSFAVKAGKPWQLSANPDAANQ